MVAEYFQYLQSMDEDGSSAPGLVGEVIDLFVANANRIRNEIAGLLSAPKTPFFPSTFVILDIDFVCSALRFSEQARGRLQQGG